MTVKLNQVLAFESSVKTRGERALTSAYQVLQKAEPLAGITRVYQPADAEGDQLPSESVLVQIKANEVIKNVSGELTELFDVAFQKESANQSAKADIVVGGQTLLANVPVTYLLFLEKKLVDLHTFVSKLPVLDPAYQWNWDDNAGAFRTDTLQSTRSKKVPKVLVKAPATDKHQADTEVIMEDVIVGMWNTTKFSGALPADRIGELVNRVEVLQKAVKVAREEANSIDAPTVEVGTTVLNYLFA